MAESSRGHLLAAKTAWPLQCTSRSPLQFKAPLGCEITTTGFQQVAAASFFHLGASLGHHPPSGHELCQGVACSLHQLVVCVTNSFQLPGVQRKCAGHGNRASGSQDLSTRRGHKRGRAWLSCHLWEAFVKVEMVSVKEDLHKRFRLMIEAALYGLWLLNPVNCLCTADSTQQELNVVVQSCSYGLCSYGLCRPHARRPTDNHGLNSSKGEGQQNPCQENQNVRSACICL